MVAFRATTIEWKEKVYDMGCTEARIECGNPLLAATQL